MGWVSEMFQWYRKKFNLKYNIHDKKGGIIQENECDFSNSRDRKKYVDINIIYFCLDKLAAVALFEKYELPRLIRNNEKLIDQVPKLSEKFDSLASGTGNDTENQAHLNRIRWHSSNYIMVNSAQ